LVQSEERAGIKKVKSVDLVVDIVAPEFSTGTA
jgi:hypothetical protein